MIFLIVLDIGATSKVYSYFREICVWFYSLMEWIYQRFDAMNHSL